MTWGTYLLYRVLDAAWRWLKALLRVARTLTLVVLGQSLALPEAVLA